MGKRIVLLRSDDAHHEYLSRLFQRRFSVVAEVMEPSRCQRRRLLKKGRYIDYIYALYHHLRRSLCGLDAYRRSYFADAAGRPPSTPACRTLTVDWINDPGVARLIREVRPDLTITICTSILQQEVLSAARLIVNVHGGFLPYYRGNHCFFFPFYRGEFDRIGSTLHFVDRGIDTGEIIENIVPPIHPDDTPEKLYCRAEKMAIHRLAEWVDHWENGGELPRRPQEMRYPLCRTRDRKPHHDLGLWLRRRTGRLAVPELPGGTLTPILLPTAQAERG